MRSSIHHCEDPFILLERFEFDGIPTRIVEEERPLFPDGARVTDVWRDAESHLMFDEAVAECLPSVWFEDDSEMEGGTFLPSTRPPSVMSGIVVTRCATIW